MNMKNFISGALIANTFYYNSNRSHRNQRTYAVEITTYRNTTFGHVTKEMGAERISLYSDNNFTFNQDDQVYDNHMDFELHFKRSVSCIELEKRAKRLSRNESRKAYRRNANG